jgi:putative molybdopterin biosynthesis protein
MIEQTDLDAGRLLIRRPVTPGANVTFTGTDIGAGETVLRRGERLTSRETGVLAALGLAHVSVVRRPRIAIISTGNELISPGAAMRPGLVFDSNATILADAVREAGGEPVSFGIVADDRDALNDALRQSLGCDVVLLSGGTSKGEGDLSYRVVGELGPPGILAHGVALKPGKPLCLAAVQVAAASRAAAAAPATVGRTPGASAAARLAAPTEDRTVPVVILPGFPTSAIFTFREFVAPVIRRFAGLAEESDAVVEARLPLRVNSERGRTEYLLVGLVAGDEGRLVAYPMGKGSGSVTTFSRADGFVVIPRQREYLEAGDQVAVHLLSRGVQPADLVVIGSHCVGLDYLLGRLRDQGLHSKFMAVGSTGGLHAARRGECDLAGIHLLDPATGTYNRSFLTDDLRLIPGYGRLQGIVFRPGDRRFEGRAPAEAVAAALGDPDCVLVNRNRGSGTRVIIDRLLGAAKPPGYLTEARSHNAVVAAVVQERADWGIAIAPVATAARLGFLPVQEEHYDFVTPAPRWGRPPVQAFRALLEQNAVRRALAALGFAAL